MVLIVFMSYPQKKKKNQLDCDTTSHDNVCSLNGAHIDPWLKY